jgi:hypothetical protein
MASKSSVREVITKEDYYNKNCEFREWVRNVKGKYLDDMSTDKARKYFDQFVEQYNAGKLEAKYYKGIGSAAIEPTQRTKYSWKFTAKLSEDERFQLASGELIAYCF